MTMSEDPLQDTEIPSDPDLAEAEISQQPSQPVKRKGGRKPVYTTVQERKQRNRMAQAAFRERRTEYIKQLEDAMKENEDLIKHLQRSNRESTEECHMLRYKTSLLEDLLHENGIDYQSELQSRSSRSLLSSPYNPQQGNKLDSPPQMLSAVDQNRLQAASTTAPQLTPIKRKAKSSSIHAINIHPNQGFDMKSEPGSARSAPMVSPFEQADLFSPPFDYAATSMGPLQPALNGSRHRFEDTRIDPSISVGESDHYYHMASHHHMGMHLDPEWESRTGDWDEIAARSSRYDRRRPNSISYYGDSQTVRQPIDERNPQSLEAVLRRRRHSPSSTMQARSVFGRNEMVQPAMMGFDANGIISHGPPPEDYELETESLD